VGKTRASNSAGITLDAGALIALDRGERRMIALLDQALRPRKAFRIPAGVVAQVWRDGRIQAILTRFLKATEVEIVPLDEHLSRSCGEICGAAGTSDVIDASVVIVAKERNDVIVTSDDDDLRRLDPAAPIFHI
jgi:predicted nucleic acid-binding protein